jgi:hypothetical protein
MNGAPKTRRRVANQAGVNGGGPLLGKVTGRVTGIVDRGQREVNHSGPYF